MIKRYKYGKNCYVIKDIDKIYKVNNKIVGYIERVKSFDKTKTYFYFIEGRPCDDKPLNQANKRIFETWFDAVMWAETYLKIIG